MDENDEANEWFNVRVERRKVKMKINIEPT